MTITTDERTQDFEPPEDRWVIERPPPVPDDAVVVTCGACEHRQHASGRALGYTCEACGSAWRVLRCRGCRKVTVVLDGTSACPRCGHEHHTTPRRSRSRVPAWLTEPEPLSVWLGGVKYLGGHAARDQPITVAGLLLDRRGIHLRAFSELFSIPWETVVGISIEGPLEISERMTTSRLLALGATTWAMSVAYLTVRTTQGDAIFEVDGLGPPQLHARLSRVLQGLQRIETPPAPIPMVRGGTVTPVPTSAPLPAPAAATEALAIPTAPESPAPQATVAPEHTPVNIDPEHSDAPLEVLVIDALWKLARLREDGLLDDADVRTLRARLLARLDQTNAPVASNGRASGPLLHV